ncbi:MAG: hypothetical protein BGP06_17190 [Rhizobiales bacterium 65-9]|nr:DUF2244 domain-containing protein [Hyphomicrobiales bacterium]OJY38159.1 MAG: hypothetical protein BGP06_17190 [Rhizobiales bacterium 65-9]
MKADNPATTPAAPSSDAAPGPDAPLFAASIHPHRSLSREGVRLVITLVAICGIISSIPFMIAGAWPIGGYFGLDVALLAIAFRVNNRRGEETEEVRLTYMELLLRRFGHKQQPREWRFNPAWVRLERGEKDEYGLQRLSLVAGGARLAIARALSPQERAEFADAFEARLAEAKRGPRFDG